MTADENDGGGLFGGGGRLGVLSTVGGSSRRLEDFELMKHSSMIARNRRRLVATFLF